MSLKHPRERDSVRCTGDRYAVDCRETDDFEKGTVLIGWCADCGEGPFRVTRSGKVRPHIVYARYGAKES